MFATFSRLRGLAAQVWGQVRWKIAVCLVLTGVLSIILLSALGFAAANMLIRRGTINVVERQVALLVQTAAASADSLAATLAGSSDIRTHRASSEQAVVALMRSLPGTKVAIRCLSGDGRLVYASPEGAPRDLPEWLAREGSFRGIVFDQGALDILAVARRPGPGGIVEVQFRVPLDQRQAALISSAAELEVGVPGPPPGRPAGSGMGKGKRKSAEAAGARRSPPPQARLWWRRLLGLEDAGSGARGFLPVVVVARDWRSGVTQDKVAFRVLPNYGMLLRQLAKYGRQQAIWVPVLGGLAVTLLLVQCGAFLLARRIARRIITAIEDVSRGAGEISRGNLAHRVEVRERDQIGQLASSVNEMAHSLEQLIANTKQQERLEQEILLSRRVQESLYPKSLPEVPGVELAGAWQPARVVSGDLYDAVHLDSGHVGLLCADVSGKGFAAALLMANLQAVVRALLRHAGRTGLPSPSELAGEINGELCRRMPDNRFITLFWADYNPATRVLRYTNAGHCPPVLITGSAQVMRLEAGGIPVGLFPQARYAEEQVRLEKGSLLLTFTDGIPEALNPDQEEFGEERLVHLCREHGVEAAGAVVDRVLREVLLWQSGAGQTDDVTMLAMKAC